MNLNESILLFDGDCGICTAFAGWARRLDPAHKFEILPFQNLSDQELQCRGLHHYLCAQRLHVISPQGKIYRGAFALNYWGWQFKRLRPLVAMLYLIPIMLLLEIILYEAVARNRHRISQWCGLRACATRTGQPLNRAPRSA